MSSLENAAKMNKRMSMVLTDEEKRQSLMKKTQDNRVEKNKADTDDLNNIELLLKTIKKLENKLSSAVEMPVSVQTDSEEVFAPWTEATNELDLVCDEMFDIDVEPIDVDQTLNDLTPVLRSEIQSSLKKSLKALLSDSGVVAEEENNKLLKALLEDETQAIIANDLVEAAKKTLNEGFVEATTPSYNGVLKEGAKGLLLGPLNQAVAGAIQLAQQTVSEAYERDRNALRSKINKIEVVRKKLTEFFERNIQDVASQCAKNDLMDRKRREDLKRVNKLIEVQLQVIESNLKKRSRLTIVYAGFDSDSPSSSEEEEESESDEEDSAEERAAKRAAARKSRRSARAAAEEAKPASRATSHYEGHSEEQIKQKLDNTHVREKAAVTEIRQLVMGCLGSQKGGVASRETSATKEDLKDLDKLQLGSKVKSSRSTSKGRLLMVVIAQVILKKPDAFPALGPMLACYADTNVSLSNFLIATTDRLSQYVDGEEYNNPWGYGNIQMAKFAEETKTMYELLLAACPQAVSRTMQPDTDYDPTIRNRKIELCGVKNDATTFIEAWVTQNNYINPRNMEQMRTDVLDIKKLWPTVKLIKACKTAMNIVRNASLQGLKLSWFQTGQLWVETIQVCHPDIKIEMIQENMKDCPEGVDDTDCVHCLERLIEGISAIALKVQGLQAGQPEKLHANSDLYLIVEQIEVDAIQTKSDKIAEDLCMTVDGYNKQTGAVKASTREKRQIPAGSVCCAVIQGKPGGRCKGILEGKSLEYHKTKLEKIDKMSGTKPPKLACCGRHFMMVAKDNNMHLGFGLPLRWNFHGDKGKKPWGREVTKADLFIKGPEQVAAAEAEEDPPKTVTVTMPIGAAAPTKAWTAPAQTLAVVNSAAAPEPAPAPSPTPAAAPAAAGEQTNADMMAILMSMKSQNEKLAEQIADNDARQELARLKLQDEVEQMKMANDGQQSATAADADRARRMERLQMIDAKKTSPAFTFK